MADIIKALREATGSAGGYLVPDEFAAKVYELIQAKTVVVPDLEQINMGTDQMYIPKVTQGSTAYWVSETGTISTSELAFGQISLVPKKVAALVEASTEVLEDSNVSTANLIVDQMARDLALKIDDEILNGTGGTFSGLRYTGSYTNSYSAGSGTTSGNISITAVSKAVDEILKDNHNFPNVSYFHPRTIGSMRVLTDSSARPIFNQETYGSPLLGQGIVGNVWGVPIKPSSQLPINLSYGTAAAQTSCADAIIGVSKMFGIYGLRRGLRFKNDYKIATDENQYQVTMRAGFSVKYPDSYCVIRAIQD